MTEKFLQREHWTNLEYLDENDLVRALEVDLVFGLDHACNHLDDGLRLQGGVVSDCVSDGVLFRSQTLKFTRTSPRLTSTYCKRGLL